tara:strand:- start:5 stop:787 length:783 start_codon:yes stop_codon:yes gene_type:complete
MSLSDEKYSTLIKTAKELTDEIVFTNMREFNNLLKPRKDYKQDSVISDADEIEQMEEELGKKIPEYYKKASTWKANIFNKIRARASAVGIGLSHSFGVPREWREDYLEGTSVLTLEGISPDYFEPLTAILDLGIENPNQVVELIILSMKMSILLGNIYSEDAQLNYETAEVTNISKENKKVIREYKKIKEKEKKQAQTKKELEQRNKVKGNILKVASVVSLINPLTPNTKQYKQFLLPLFNNVPEKDRIITLSFDNITIG